jgi:hypothetical protein
MAKSQDRSTTKFLLSQVPKRGRAEIARIMAEQDGHLTLEEFLARRWNFEAMFSAKEVAQRTADTVAQLAREHPTWSTEQIRATLPFLYLTMNLKEMAVARRFTLGDPAELGRGLSVLSRLRWLECLINGYTYVDFNFVVEAFAVRDLAVAEYLAVGQPCVAQGELGFLDLCTLAVSAIYRKDEHAFRSVIQKMAREKSRPWQQGIHTCLMGMVEQEPEQVARGLMLLLDGMRTLRQKAELEEAICLAAHGLYRLGEWISPALVAGYDAAQACPWDVQFHTWSEEHPDPLAGLDLSNISPVLHEAVVLLQPPAWWTAPS